METQHTNTPRDPQLWELAKRRASFRGHLVTYLIFSAFFWLVWFASNGPRYNSGLPWPVWPMLGWGIGVLFHYMGAFMAPKTNNVEREYQKLLAQRDQE
ncbi:2TM domain-containing protein [Pseudocnuella soli]|uniref:2TM domain-containing protein n=1 Tax=Pseudocnuella soli TaxID=2502779 RepID=UPI00104AA7F0|nr:2TM domain-containing protein [Pseudocnuella soli]